MMKMGTLSYFPLRLISAFHTLFLMGNGGDMEGSLFPNEVKRCAKSHDVIF